jgi:DNA-binding IclR family transcriptional regulator
VVRNSARPLGMVFTVGMRLPAYLSGSGKAMLAFREPDEVRRIFAAGLHTHLTRKGPREVEVLLKELAVTRKRGHSANIAMRCSPSSARCRRALVLMWPHRLRRTTMCLRSTRRPS